MKVDQLPERARSALKVLQQGIVDALNVSTTEHVKATSGSKVPDGFTVEQALNGGSIDAPSKPWIPHDEEAVTELHRQVHRASEGTLYAIVIEAERSSAGEDWELQTKLISVAEHEELVQARRPIDVAVEVELRTLLDAPGWEQASFGRISSTLPVKLGRFGKNGRDQLEPTTTLLTQLSTAEQLYRDAGHRLIIANWTLNQGGNLSFREHFE